MEGVVVAEYDGPSGVFYRTAETYLSSVKLLLRRALRVRESIPSLRMIYMPCD